MAFANDCLSKAGVPLTAIQSLTAGQRTQGEKTLVLRGPDGQPVDLTAYGIPGEASSSSSAECGCTDPEKHGVEIVLKEMPTSCNPYWRGMAEVKPDDAAKGVLTIPILCENTTHPGIWLAEATVWQQGVQRLQMPFYWYVTGSLQQYNPVAPLSLAEVRLHLRDRAPEDNFLLDAVEYSDEEIMACIRAPIDQWNAEPPPVGEFTPMNFPWRYPWREAVLGELFILAAIHMRRNDLDYAAAGVQVSDTKKYPDYFKMGQERRQEWMRFLKQKKVEINIENGFGSLGGYYGYQYG